MTPAEFHHLVETRRIHLEWALNWRASVDTTPPQFAWGDSAMAAVERLAEKAGWLAPESLFTTQDTTTEEA